MMYERLIQGLIIGFAVTFCKIIYSSQSFNKAQKISLYVLSLIPFFAIPLAILYYFYNTSSFFKSNEAKKLINIDNSKDALVDLYNNELINQNEYNEKLEILEKEKLEESLKKDNSYINLKNLYDSKILSKEEFEQKVSLLRNKLKSSYEITKENEKLLKIEQEEKSNTKVRHSTNKGDIYILPCISMIGQKAYFGENIAPDGIYKFNFSHSIEVRDGVIIDESEYILSYMLIPFALLVLFLIYISSKDKEKTQENEPLMAIVDSAATVRTETFSETTLNSNSNIKDNSTFSNVTDDNLLNVENSNINIIVDFPTYPSFNSTKNRSYIDESDGVKYYFSKQDAKDISLEIQNNEITTNGIKMYLDGSVTGELILENGTIYDLYDITVNSIIGKRYSYTYKNQNNEDMVCFGSKLYFKGKVYDFKARKKSTKEMYNNDSDIAKFLKSIRVK